MVTKELLYTVYIVQKNSLRKTGLILNLPKWEIERLLKIYEIPKRNKLQACPRKPLSEDHKNKISIANIGKKLSEEHINNLKGRTPWNKEKGHKDRICCVCGSEFKDKPYRRKKFCSAECRDNVSGEKHHNFKGKEPRGEQTKRNWSIYRRLKKEVHTRDKQCLKCACKKSLECHYIIPWYKDKALRFDSDNCISLCKKCHKELHKFCGQKKIDLDKQKIWLETNLICTGTNTWRRIAHATW